MNKGLIADIQRCSTHDGPGVRTTVFFKGCPLKCEWCHNPECISFEKQTMFYPEKCIGCGQCHKGCYAGARVLCGKEYGTEELFAQILQDKPYYGEKGGVTFSGGEPFAQAEFLGKITDLCKRENIHCGVETSLIYFNEDVLRKMDLVMADLKIWDNNLHKQYTGVGNELIFENLKRLLATYKSVWIRIPIIPTVNDTEEEIRSIRSFLLSCGTPENVELLPYHAMGEHKYAAIGKEAQIFSTPSEEKMMRLKKIFL